MIAAESSFSPLFWRLIHSMIMNSTHDCIHVFWQCFISGLWTTKNVLNTSIDVALRSLPQCFAMNKVAVPKEVVCPKSTLPQMSDVGPSQLLRGSNLRVTPLYILGFVSSIRNYLFVRMLHPWRTLDATACWTHQWTRHLWDHGFVSDVFAFMALWV